MKYIRSKTIEEATRSCREAWAGYPDARVAWCCHHAIRIEALTEPVENRITYILEEKPEWQHIMRLDNFRPMTRPFKLPISLRAALQAHVKAIELVRGGRKLVKLLEEKLTYNGVAEEAYDLLHDICAAENSAAQFWDTFMFGKIEDDKTKEVINELHLLDVPDHTWNGENIGCD